MAIRVSIIIFKDDTTYKKVASQAHALLRCLKYLIINNHVLFVDICNVRMK